MMKRGFFALLAAAAISTPVLVAPAMFTPAAAQVGLNVTIGVPPPAPIFEMVPAPRVGYVWAPGSWRWEHDHHVWGPGRWMEARHGEHWVADRWDHRDGPHGGWYHERGHFDRDHGSERHSFNEEHRFH